MEITDEEIGTEADGITQTSPDNHEDEQQFTRNTEKRFIGKINKPLGRGVL